MIHDFIKMTVWMTEKMDKYTKQCIGHHIAVITAFFCSFYCGFAYPGVCVLFLIAEASTIFLTYNDMFGPERSHTTPAIINKVTFFIVFTVTRIIMWPYLQYLLYWNLKFSWNIVGVMRNSIAIFGIIQGFAIMILNLYWYYKILRKLVRIIKGTDG